MAFQIRRARELYAAAGPGIRALSPWGRLTTLAASRLYAGILTEIEALGYDVFRARAHLAPAQKVRALPASRQRSCASRFRRTAKSRIGVSPGDDMPGAQADAPAEWLTLGNLAVSSPVDHQGYG